MKPIIIALLMMPIKPVVTDTKPVSKLRNLEKKKPFRNIDELLKDKKV